MSQQDRGPRKPYSPPELEELGTVDEQTHFIASAHGEPAPERPGPQLPR